MVGMGEPGRLSCREGQLGGGAASGPGYGHLRQGIHTSRPGSASWVPAHEPDTRPIFGCVRAFDDTKATCLVDGDVALGASREESAHAVEPCPCQTCSDQCAPDPTTLRRWVDGDRVELPEMFARAMVGNPTPEDVVAGAAVIGEEVDASLTPRMSALIF